MQPSPRLRFPRVVHGLLIALSLGLLAAVLWHDRAAISGLADRRPDPRLLVLALLLTQANLLLVFGRWTILVRALDRNISIRTAMLLGFLGYFFNLVLPGAVGGDLAKAACLARMRIKRTQAIASMVMDRLLGLLGLLLLAAIAGGSLWNDAAIPVRRLILVAGGLSGIGLTAFAILLFRPPLWSLTRGIEIRHPRVSAMMTELRAMAGTYRERPGVLVVGLTVSLVSHGLTVLVFFVLGRALFGPGMTTTLAQHFLMAPLTLLTMAIPLPFGALGLGEEVSSQLFGMVGHPSGAVVLMAVRVLMLACGLESAVVYLLKFPEIGRPLRTRQESQRVASFGRSSQFGTCGPGSGRSG